MAYNKTKHLDAAHKYLQQGKLPQAISEYMQILKNEPKDQVTLMTLGDLYVRQGETFQALEYFERLAKIFLNDGFTTKAIAIYKKVAKLAPEESRPLERLAELYVQQGVLSEARPIYLQLAEVQLKAGRQPQAATLLRKLLEAEPDNLRVQTRLAELQLSMGQQKEAVETFHNAMQRVLEHGDNAEAIRLADRILQLDPAHQSTFLLKVRALSAAGKSEEAAGLLESLEDRNAGGETTTMLLEIFTANAQWEKASGLAEKVFAREPKNYLVAHRVANTLLDNGELDRARSLVALVRNTMIDSGDHEILAQTISRLSEAQPMSLEPLEWLVDLHGRASDSFRLPDALAQLAHAYEVAGDESLALATYEKLLERTPEDETTRRKFLRLRSQIGLEPMTGEMPQPVKLAPNDTGHLQAASSPSQPALEEETQRYVTQALTDVDLFSSYGLTQKAIDLLETVLERAPRHAPVLERLLDLSVGGGNDKRTAELAGILEQIAVERQDRAAAERYAEFGRRYKHAGGASPGNGALLEFAVPTEVPLIEAELDEPAASVPPQTLRPEPMGIPMPVESVVHEVDLSDEWAALSLQLEDAMQSEPAAAPAENGIVPRGVSSIPEPFALPSADATAHEELQEVELTDSAIGIPAFDIAVEAPAEVANEVPAFELELQPVASMEAEASETFASDTLMSDLAGDLESATMSLGLPAEMTNSKAGHAVPSTNASVTPSASSNGVPAKAPSNADSLDGTLNDLFEEFRSELGEVNKDDEDLETHYNLGIAYREMGLLEEAISEFQKVAQSADKGPAFRYAMQCSTLLGLAFMDKGQPAIAAIWYERALKTPGLDPESILALRYDLGVAQELAGERAAAFGSFSQVYAMNIDYRDVSERIALLGKAR